MFVYNITIKVNNPIVEQWINWQFDEHIPEIMSTGLFEEYKFFRLLDQDDTEGQTFVLQFYTSIKKSYDQYIQQHAAPLREKAFAKWGNGFFAFRSLLQSVQ